MNKINYPFKEKKSTKIFFFTFIACSILLMASSIISFIFYSKKFEFQYLILGILSIIFSLLFILESVYLAIKKTITTDNSIIQYGIFGKNEIIFDKNCIVSVEETTSSTSCKISIEYKSGNQSIIQAFDVEDYTIDSCLDVYKEYIKPLKDKGLNIKYSTLLKSLFKAIEKKYFIKDDKVKQLFIDFESENKEEIIEKRNKKLKSLNIAFIALEAMLIFLVTLTSIKPLINNGSTYSNSDIVFLFLYGILFVFVAIYILYQKHRIKNKSDSDIKK